MDSCSAFHLDCNPVIPECGFNCPKCIQEIESTLTALHGVGKVYLGTVGKEQGLIVEHNPAAVSVEKLMEVFKGLPTFYEGFFIPTLISSTKEQS